MVEDTSKSYFSNQRLVVTNKCVLIVNLLLKIIILLYFIGYDMIYEGNILSKEFIDGQVSYQVFGRAYSKDDTGKIVGSDVGDVVRNFPEDGALFIVTKRYFFQAQQISYECGSPCEANSDCPKAPPYEQAICTPQKRCKQLRWCPPFTKLEYKAIDLFGIEDFLIKFRANLNLDGATPKERSQISKEVGINLKEIVTMSGEKWGKLRSVGGVIRLRLVWECSMKYDCKHKVQVTNIEKAWKPLLFDKTKISYYVEDAITFKQNNVQTRELNLRVGIKIYVESSGGVKRLDLIQIIKKILICLVLLMICERILQAIAVRSLPIYKRRKLQKESTQQIDRSSDE